MRLAIADPPYPPQISDRLDAPCANPRVYSRSRARRYYGDGTRSASESAADFHPDAGLWDHPETHRALLEQLHRDYDGWAIATTMEGVDHYGRLPAGARILVWQRSNSAPSGHRISTTLEAVLVYPPITRRGRPQLGQVPDLLRAGAPRGGFTGAKPVAWTRWVLDALGYDSTTDELVDVFPGSGAVATAASQGILL